MKKLFLLGAMVCALGMMTACKSGTANENTNDCTQMQTDIFALGVMPSCKNENNKTVRRFFPIHDSGYTYAYVSAERYGLAGGHERIMIQKDTNNIDSNYCFYGNELYIAPSADGLMVFVPKCFVVKGAEFSDPDIEIVVLAQTEYNKLKAEAGKRGLTRISVYPPDKPQDTIFVDDNSIPIFEQ